MTIKTYFVLSIGGLLILLNITRNTSLVLSKEVIFNPKFESEPGFINKFINDWQIKGLGSQFTPPVKVAVAVTWPWRDRDVNS